MSSKKSIRLYQEIQTMLGVHAQQANEWVRFSERHTQINAETFVQILVLGWLKQPDASLNQLAHSACDLGLKVSSAALHARMGPSAVMLLAGVLKLALEAFRKPCPIPLALLRKFRGVYITDSTQIALPDAMASIFRGNQTSNSMLKLQVVWDYLNGNLAAIELEAGRQPDQKCQLPVSHAQAGTLQLFDLGYFKQEYLHAIDQQGAYFVSRYQSQTTLYHLEDEKAFDLSAWLKGRMGNHEIQLRLGSRVKVPVRLLARRLSPVAAAARRRKAKQKARKQGKTCSAKYLFLLNWDILVTNLTAAEWPLASIFDLYSIRFQIEWLFRVWKSEVGLDKLGDWKAERVLCQVYAHLLAALLIQILTAGWRWGEFEYSVSKSVQIIQTATHDLMRCFARGGWGFGAWMKRLEDDFRVFGRKTKRRKSPSTAQIIDNWGLF